MTAGLLALCYVATMCQDKPDEWWESEFSKEVDKMLPRDIFHRAPQVDDMKRIDEDILRELIAHRFLEFLRARSTSATMVNSLSGRKAL